MCADICDTADEVIQEDLNHALANIPRYSGVSATECQCGEEIPEGRRVAIPGVQLCIDCANREALEKNGVAGMSKYLSHKKKPEWKDAPSWANYLAMDAGDEWYWYECEPVKKEHILRWVSSGKTEYCRPHYADKWHDSLEPRP